jgi:hypothetical protein
MLDILNMTLPKYLNVGKNLAIDEASFTNKGRYASHLFCKILFNENWRLFNKEIEIKHNSRLTTYKEDDQSNAKLSNETLDSDEDLTEGARK